MEKGLTSQLTNRVIKRPLGFLPTWTMELKSIFSIIGKIISQMRTTMGTLTWLPSANSMAESAAVIPGKRMPSTTPATMQTATQMVRYRSKTFILFVEEVIVFTFTGNHQQKSRQVAAGRPAFNRSRFSPCRSR